MTDDSIKHKLSKLEDMIRVLITKVQNKEHDAVTLAGTPDYITITAQEITRNQIDLTTDVTGVLPDANVSNTITLDNITQITNRSHTNLTDIGTNTHANIDTHIADTTDAHTISSDTLTFTNKSISLTTNTITGTTAQFNTALTDNDFATLAGSETLTNKTLTSPIINTQLTGTAVGTGASQVSAGNHTHSTGAYTLASFGYVQQNFGNTFYCAPNGQPTANGSENQVEARVSHAGTWRNMQFRITFNNINTGTSTITSRVANANGNQTVSIAAASTGLFTDDTNTDSISSGNTISFVTVTSGASGRIDIVKNSSMVTYTV